MRKFILNDKKEVVELQPDADIYEFAKWFSDSDNRRVKVTKVGEDRLLSTFFIAYDHSFLGEGPPEIFETMLFYPGTERSADLVSRASTYKESLQQHDNYLKVLNGGGRG